MSQLILDYLSLERIRAPLYGETKDDIIAEMAVMLQDERHDAATLEGAILAREELSSTGIGHGVADHRPQMRAERFVHADVGHQAIAKEGIRPLLGEVEKLVGHDDLARVQQFPQRPAGRDRDDALDAQLLEGEDVGPVIDLGRHQAVPPPVAGDEGDAHALQRPDDERVRGLAERRAHATLLDVLQARHLVQATAPDDADANGLCVIHKFSSW